MLNASYKLLFTGVWVLIPIVVLLRGNAFRSRRSTLVRGIVATLVAWLWLVASSIWITRIDLALASTGAEIDRVVNDDGARHIGAILMGWAPSAVLALACWAAIRGYRATRRHGTADA